MIGEIDTTIRATATVGAGCDIPTEASSPASRPSTRTPRTPLATDRGSDSHVPALTTAILLHP